MPSTEGHTSRSSQQGTDRAPSAFRRNPLLDEIWHGEARFIVDLEQDAPQLYDRPGRAGRRGRRQRRRRLERDLARGRATGTRRDRDGSGRDRELAQGRPGVGPVGARRHRGAATTCQVSWAHVGVGQRVQWRDERGPRRVPGSARQMAVARVQLHPIERRTADRLPGQDRELRLLGTGRGIRAVGRTHRGCDDRRRKRGPGGRRIEDEVPDRRPRALDRRRAAAALDDPDSPVHVARGRGGQGQARARRRGRERCRVGEDLERLRTRPKLDGSSTTWISYWGAFETGDHRASAG